MKHAKFVSFTLCGAQTVQKTVKLLPDFRCERYARTVDASLSGTSLKRFTQQAMVDCDLIVFVGATGIAVRAAAPYLMGKAYDPAVIVIDEQGKFVIPLLSGHLGGANEIAKTLAEGLQAVPVLTTATDGRQVFAVDTWAKAHDCAVVEPHYIKYVSGALLRGENVGVRSDFPIDGLLPARIDLKKDAESGFTIGFRTDAQPFAHTLHLVPRIAYLGIGCRKGTSADVIEQTVQAALASAKLPWQAICGAASIDIKQNEPGLLLFCEKHKLPFRTFTAEQLQDAQGEFSRSAFVQQTVGVDNVCERAAVCASQNGTLILHKFAQNGVTAAVAVPDWRVTFEEQEGEA